MGISALVLALAGVSSVRANSGQGASQPVAPDSGFAPTHIVAGPNADLLKQAYVALSRADHDYKGHRAKAMGHVKEAGKLLGVELGGEGAGHEKQWVSDDQMKEGRRLLEQVRTNLTGSEHKRVLKQVGNAIEEVDAALAIK